jgi:aminopeptidase N
VAHEYFHNWTGNRITCRDWFQLCLKEGLTVYRDQEFSADERSATVQRITDVRQLRTHQFPEDAGPLAHPVRPESYIEINNFYTSTVYEKGAELVRMIETILGRDRFRQGMDLYFDRHDGTAATIEDFIRCFEDASGQSLDHFKLWYSQAGTPELVCNLEWNRAAKTADLTIQQVQPSVGGEGRGKPLHIPVRLGLVGGDGQDLPLAMADGTVLADGLLHVTEQSQTFSFQGIASRPVPSLLRGFSAPVNLLVDISERDLEFLMANDSDLFNRWQSAYSYATRTLVGMVAALAGGKRPGRGLGYARALGTSLRDDRLEPAYRAELLKLPTQSDIAREIGRNVDPGLIHQAHRRLCRTVGSTLAPELEAIYAAMTDRKPFAPDAISCGRRALRNACLTLLAARGEDQDHARIARHYFKAGNMTDAAHALALLSQSPTPEREKALADFHERWKGDHLVIDTWFAVQAQSSLDTTIDDVRRLARDPLFQLTAPNKVRALIGAFALNNPLQFNRPDGEGYNLVVEKVLELDRFNPQIASRILGAFRSWRSLEPQRRRLAKKALGRIAKAPEPSRDLYEIVTKMLES